MSRRKEVTDLVRAIRKSGGEVTTTPSGHLRVFNPRTRRSIRIPSTPSDVRALRNMRTRLKRIGLLTGTAG